MAADAAGVAALPLHVASLPGALAGTGVGSGESWSWQVLVRDGATWRASNAVAVDLW